MKGLLSLLMLCSFAVNANGLLRTTDLKKYCDQDGVNRQTVIYLDQSIIAKKDPLWYKDIYNKTKFLPGERVQVVTINDGGSTVELAWDTCFPSYTPKTYKQRKSNEGATSIFLGGIDDKLKNDSKEFKKFFMRALAHPLANSRHETKPTYKSDFPEKKLVEALYYDANRLDIKSGIARVIVFSDMIENSNLISKHDFDPKKEADKVAKRFPVFMNNAAFYIYGINYTNSDTDLNQNLEKFWKRFLLKSGAQVAHYGTQLVLPKENNLFSVKTYQGKLTQSDGMKLSTNLRLGILPKGELIHSWVSIGDKYMTLAGTVSCSGQNCQLNAKIVESSFDAGFSANDILHLSGTLELFKGEIGGRDDSVVDQKGKLYRFDVEYDLESK